MSKMAKHWAYCLVCWKAGSLDLQMVGKWALPLVPESDAASEKTSVDWSVLVPQLVEEQR